jgi:hypothetical protein
MQDQKSRLDMNGYRDPKAREEERQRLLEELRRFPIPADVSRGGGGAGGGKRQCGYRKSGGIYAEVPTSIHGKPLEHFLACPPVKIDPQEYRLHPKGLGVKLVELPETCEKCKGGGSVLRIYQGETAGKPTDVTVGYVCPKCNGLGVESVAHVFDIVGQDNYPNVADFLEEARRLGVSRRLELEGGEYARLTPRSRLILLHKRAVIENPEPLYGAMGDLELARMRRADCPKKLAAHRLDKLPDIDPPVWATPHVAPGCAALYWHLLEGGKIVPETAEAEERIRRGSKEVVAGRFVERRLESGTYRGYCPPEGVEPVYGLGIFAVFPLVKIVVIDPEGEHKEEVDKASRAELPVEVKDR